MKLASLRRGGRDGTLVVVDRHLGHAVAVPAIAATLQQALETWVESGPRLAAVAAALASGGGTGAFALLPDQLASPLPRSYQFLDGSVYLHHLLKARHARGAAMPSNHLTEPLMYQCVSDCFCGPCETLQLPSEDLEIGYEAEIAIVVDDVPMGVSAAAAVSHIKLVMWLNDVTARADPQ